MNWPNLPEKGAFATWKVSDSEKARKTSASERLKIYQEDFKDVILKKIDAAYTNQTVRDRVTKFISVALNPAKDITNAVAMCYDNGVRRILKGGDEKTELSFNKLIEQSEAATKAPIWNKFAFLLGPTFVIPTIRKNKLKFDIITPDVCDIKLDPEDPLDLPSAMVWNTADGNYSMLDKEAWYYLNDEGKNIREPQYHNIGRVPCGLFRLDEPINSWWPRKYQERLIDGTLEVAFTYTVLKWIRKSQDKKILSVIGDSDNIPKGQMLDPEYSFTIKADPQAVQVQVIDFDTSPENCLNTIRYVMESIIEAYGIPQSAVNYDLQKDGGNAAITIKKEKLGGLRTGQIPYLNRGEKQLWGSSVALLRAANHPLGSSLPPPDEIEEMLELQWPRLRVVDNPTEREQLYQMQIKRGGVSPIDMLQEDYPNLTREECEKKMYDNIDDWAKVATILAERNLSVDMEKGIMTSAEVNGKLGGLTKSANQEKQQ